MEPPSPARKVATVVKAVLLVAVFLFCGAQAVIMVGTKANMTFVPTSPKPGSPAVTTAQRTATATTGAPAAAKATTTPTARP